ncbi:arabinose ABC transporter permease [Kribbella sp. ALI-6-A]|uniref:MFS transporter n=1 Tax=Kribbella sp. ALI-6-A TaxID=1933817 RepID=UPI00097C4E58|nr:MFS transporter [Kribbella sp. ALI-6-A]ONI66791.1 arabinose ABC transporter permease [Kribbella sp. ALI-6-A]
MTSARTDSAPVTGAAGLTLPVVLAGVVLVAMSISGTAVALPSIGSDLDASGSPLNWVVAGYNLAFAAMTLVAGATADRIGRRRVFVGAAGVFAFGFLATALSPSIVVADVARIVSGAGAAGAMAAGGALLASAYDGPARNRAFALMGTMAGVGIAIGPTLSGLLITATGWRGGFVVFAIIGLLVAVGGTRLQESRSPGGSADWLGSVLLVVALSLLMYAVLEAPAFGWADPRIVVALVIGLLALVVFAIVQRRTAAPVLAPALVANRQFMAWCLATVTTSIGFLGVLVFLPTYLQAAAGSSPAVAGLTMLLLTAPVLVMPMIAVSLVNKGTSARLLILVALAFVVGGNLSLVALRPGSTVAVVAVPLLLIGIGMGASFGLTDGQAMSLVPPDTVGAAAGFLNTLRGAAEAMVIAGFSASLLGFLSSELDGDTSRAADVSSGRLSDQAAAELDAFTRSWQLTQLCITILCLLLSVVVAVLIARRPTDADVAAGR